jgi:hypothetical protein
MEISVDVPQEIKNKEKTIIDPAIPLLDTYLKELKVHMIEIPA